MGSGAYPVLYDWNNDGLKDLFVANFAVMTAQSMSMGCSNPTILQGSLIFKISELRRNRLSNGSPMILEILKKGTINRFILLADLDQNGTIDMLCGNMDGTLTFFPNQNPIGQLSQFGTPVPNYQNISVSSFSHSTTI